MKSVSGDRTQRDHWTRELNRRVTRPWPGSEAMREAAIDHGQHVD